MERTVLITGCSSGIGRATAEAFLDEEWTVYATARNPADIQTLGEREGCHVGSLDVNDRDDVERVVDRILDETGRIDCLVNNAGYGQLGPVEEIPTDAVEDQFNVNVFGPHRLIKAVLPSMRRREDGTIVNVSSVLGRIVVPGTGAYASSKFALEAMTDALRNEVAEYGIDAVLVEPGPVDTGFDDRAESELDDLERTGAYGSFYSLYEDYDAVGGSGVGAIPPEEVAEAIVNAASATKPAARYPVGTLATAGEIGRYLPTWLVDGLWSVARKLL